MLAEQRRGKYGSSMKWGYTTLALGLFSTSVSCGPQPCPEAGDGPQVRIDVALNTCNHTPEAVVSGPRTGMKQQPSVFDGSDSFDVDGDEISLRWELIAQPESSLSTILPTTMSKAELQPDAAGDYVVQLLAYDGTLISKPVQHTLRVANRAPVANAGPDTSGPLGQALELDGSGSQDPDGDPLTYSWMLTTRPAGSNATLTDATSAKAHLTSDVQGLYVAALVVNDGELQSTADQVQIGGGVIGSGPVARATGTLNIGINETATFDGTGSTDPDGDPLTYAWSIVTQPAGAMAQLNATDQPTATLTPSMVGTYDIQLRVSDGFYTSDPATVTLTVTPPVPWLVNSIFDPDEVYFFGSLVPRECASQAISRADNPNVYRVGFSCADSDFGYGLDRQGFFYYIGEDHRAYQFIADAPDLGGSGQAIYPPNPNANDIDVTPAGCVPANPNGDGNPMRMIVGPGGPHFNCTGDYLRASDGMILFPGAEYPNQVPFNEDFAWGDEFGVGRYLNPRGGGTPVPVVGLSSTYYRALLIVWRATSNGFLTVVREQGGDELWEVTNQGLATLRGVYPPNLTGIVVAGTVELDAQGRLYQSGSRGPHNLVIRRTVGGIAELIYDEANGPSVRYFANDALVTSN